MEPIWKRIERLDLEIKTSELHTTNRANSLTNQGLRKRFEIYRKSFNFDIFILKGGF